MPPDERRPRAIKIKPETFASVIRAFLASDKFQTKLQPSTKSNYGRLLRIAERPDVLGAVPVEEMRPALVQAYLDGFADRPAQQRTAQTAIKSLEKWALVRDLLPHAISTGTEAPGSDGGHVPWTDDQVAFAERHARPHLARVITLAANTGQRGSDLVKMRWSDIEEFERRPGINVRQVKTGLEIWVPFTRQLMTAISTWERRPGFILLKEGGHPFTRQQLSDQWLRERDTRPALAPLQEAGLVIHGLRGTAVVRLRRAGATVPQICDMVGMSPQMVTRYCRYSVQRENALAAVHILDRTAGERSLADGKKNRP
jgi:integrase